MTDITTAAAFPAAASILAPEAEPIVEQAAPSPTEVLIEAWFADSFFGTAVSRDTPTFNVVRAAVDDLKNRLKEA